MNEVSLRDIPVQLLYAINDKRELQLYWSVKIHEVNDINNFYEFKVDAISGKIISQNQLMATCVEHEVHNVSEACSEFKIDDHLSSILKKSSDEVLSCTNCYEVFPYPMEN